MRNIQKDLEAYEARFGKTKSGVNTITLEDMRLIVKKNKSSGFDWYGVIMDALEIGYLMGYRKAERTIRSSRKGEATRCKENG